METYRNEQTEIKPVADPDISFGGGGHEARGSRRRWCRGDRAWGGGIAEGIGCGEGVLPRGWGVGRGYFFKSFILKNCVFWSILMSKCASHVYTCLAYFHFHQYKPTSYNYARVKTSY